MTDAKKKYAVLDSLRHDGEDYSSGDAVEMTDKQAKPLIAAHVIGELGSQGDGGGNNPPEGEERTQAIKDAILSLDKENADLFTQSGTPKTDAIEAVTGWPVSAKERDATIEVLTAEGLLGAE